MPIITIVFGGLLFVLGVASYVLTGRQSVTALIPAAFGLVFEVLGLLARKPNLRKHAMHGAAALALIGFVATVRGVLQAITLAQGGTVERPQAVIARAIMSVLCLVFVALCVNSFIAARRNR
jgi:hypothetical protein